MDTLPLNIPRYPMLRWITCWGGWLATLAALAATGVLAYASTTLGNSLYTLGAAGCGIVVFIMLRSLVELVRLITDMLLPKP